MAEVEDHGLCYFKADGTYIGGFGYQNRATITFTTPNNIGYALCSVVTESSSYRYDLNIFQIEVGESATSYIESLQNNYRIDLRDISPVLPREYQEVEYIEGTSNQYIDTGFKPNQDTRVEMELISTANNTNFIFGARTTSITNSFTFLNLNTAFRTDYYNVGNGLNRTRGKRYLVDKNKNVTTVTDVETSSTATVTATYRTVTPDINAYLFSCHSSDAVLTNAYMQLYWCKIYDNGTLVRNYIPCYRISDNKIGLYDLVNSEFYVNSGTSEFLKGENVYHNPIELCKIGNYQDKLKLSTGKNLFDSENATIKQNYAKDDNGNEIASAGTNYTTSYTNVSPNTNYTLSYNLSSTVVRLYYYDENKNWISRSGNIKNSSNYYTFTTPNNCHYIQFQNVVGFGIAQLELRKPSNKSRTLWSR